MFSRRADFFFNMFWTPRSQSDLGGLWDYPGPTPDNFRVTNDHHINFLTIFAKMSYRKKVNLLIGRNISLSKPHVSFSDFQSIVTNWPRTSELGLELYFRLGASFIQNRAPALFFAISWLQDVYPLLAIFTSLADFRAILWETLGLAPGFVLPPPGPL